MRRPTSSARPKKKRAPFAARCPRAKKNPLTLSSLPTFSANERTFLAWMSMAVTLGGVSTALVGFTAQEDPRSEFF